MSKIISIIIAFFSPMIVFGCSFTPDADRAQSAEANVSKYPTIFVATVAEKKELSDFVGNTYSFDVVKTYKGNHLKTRKLSSPGHSCGSFFGVGQVGLFFLGEDETTIDEANPQYYFESIDQAITKADEIFTQEVVPVTIPPAEPVVVCTDLREPVCGELVVQCIKAPCPPAQVTYNNQCELEKAGARFIQSGACREVEPNSEKQTNQEPFPSQTAAPTEGPLVNHVPPSSAPPYYNKPDIQIEKQATWWEKFTRWISGLFSWFFK